MQDSLKKWSIYGASFSSIMIWDNHNVIGPLDTPLAVNSIECILIICTFDVIVASFRLLPFFFLLQISFVICLA